MWGRSPHLKEGPSPQFRKCLCLYTDSPHPKLLLPMGAPCVIFNKFYLEKYTFVQISQEEKVSCFSMKKSDKNYKNKTTRRLAFNEP